MSRSLAAVAATAAALFVGAAVAFGFAFYVLGVWLALGCAAAAAWVATAEIREDRPSTVAALEAVQAELKQLHERTSQLTLHFTSAFPLQQRRRSLMMPPQNGGQP